MVTIILALFGFTARPTYLVESPGPSMDEASGEWDHMMGHGGYGELFMWLVLVIVTGMLLYFIFKRRKDT